MTSLFRRQKEIKQNQTNYRVENVRSNQAVIINEQSVLVGDIFAPQITVFGMVYGYVVANEVVVEPSGQIWGDICSVSTVTLPGSKVHGWISSMDEGTIDLLRLGQLAIEGLPRSGEMATSAEKKAELQKYTLQIDQDHGLDSERVEAWRALRSAAAAAISARAELEQIFEAAVLETAMNIQTNEINPEARDDWVANMAEPEVGEKADGEDLTRFQLVEANTEIALLKSQLTTILPQQAALRNELISTKALLQEAEKHRSGEKSDYRPIEGDVTGSEHGRDLASLQATIVEMDLKLQELQAKIDTREEQLIRLKTLAARRIETLELELAKIQGQNRSK